MSRFGEILLEVIEMRKLIAILLCAVIMLLALAGCGPKCEHNYTSKVTKEATYEEEGQMEYTCSKCGDTYTEAIAKKERHVIPTDTLNEAFSYIKFESGIFSMYLGELVQKGISNYKVQFMTGEDAIKKGYLKSSELGNDVDINYVYYVVVSGDVMVNPDIPYYTTYFDTAIKGWMLFDENDNLGDYSISMCENLRTCAILLMSSY